MGTQTVKFKEMKRCQRMKKISQIWSSSLVVVAVLGILVLLLSYFLPTNSDILLFGQMLTIVAYFALFFFSYMLMLRGNGRTINVLLIMLGSGGVVFGLISQIMLDQIGEKPPTLNMAGVMLAIGVLNCLNSRYYDTDTRS